MRIWKAVQLFVAFHKDQKRKDRETPYLWPPTGARASVTDKDDSAQETFVLVKGEGDARDVQIKLRPDKIVLRRDPDVSWEGVVVEDHMISVQVGGAWVRIKADGSVSHERGGDMTYVESDGSVLKKTEFVDAMMSGDGVELSRRTPTSIAAITEDGVLAKPRTTMPEIDFE